MRELTIDEIQNVSGADGLGETTLKGAGGGVTVGLVIESTMVGDGLAEGAIAGSALGPGGVLLGGALGAIIAIGIYMGSHSKQTGPVHTGRNHSSSH